MADGVLERIDRKLERIATALEDFVYEGEEKEVAGLDAEPQGQEPTEGSVSEAEITLDNGGEIQPTEKQRDLIALAKAMNLQWIFNPNTGQLVTDKEVLNAYDRQEHRAQDLREVQT